MTGKTPFQHFIKLLFLWEFLHFCWNEQVSMHDLFCNELWLIFLSTLKWVASSGHQNTVSSPSHYAYGNKHSVTHVRKQANWKEVYILCVFVCVCLGASMCKFRIAYSPHDVSQKSGIVLNLKFSCAEQGGGKSNTFWIGPTYPRLIFWESCSS